MNYPQIFRLKKYFDPDLVAKFDAWLGTRDQTFVPSQFAEFGVSETVARELMVRASLIGIIDTLSCFKCSKCLSEFEAPSAEQACPACGAPIEPIDIQVVFQADRRAV